MGQYFKIANLTKQQYLCPWTFGDGAKLLEFGASASGTMAGLAVLLASGNGRGGGDLRSDHPIIGSWAGDAIVIAGDYADVGAFAPKGVGLNLYHYADEHFEDVSYQVIEALAADPYLKHDLILRTSWKEDKDLDRILGKDRKERAREMAQEQATYLRPDQVITLKRA